MPVEFVFGRPVAGGHMQAKKSQEVRLETVTQALGSKAPKDILLTPVFADAFLNAGLELERSD